MQPPTPVLPALTGIEVRGVISGTSEDMDSALEGSKWSIVFV